MHGLTRQQKMMIAVLLSGTLLVVLNATLLSPALPSIMRDTGVDATTVQWLTSGYMLTEAVVIPLNAFFVGRFKTRTLFIGGIIWFAIASLVAGLAPNFYVILLGRVMMAMATGIIMPMTFTLMLLIFPREQRGAAMGVIGLIISFAPAIGPTLSGLLVDTVGWRMLFIIVACLAAVVVLFALFSLTNFEGFERVPLDPASVVLLLCGMIPLLYGISSATSAENKLVPAALIAVGIVLLALFVRRQIKLDTPMLRVEVLKTRRYRTSVLLIALLQASLVGSGVVLPIFVQQVMGQTATVSGLLMLPGAVLGAIAGMIAGRLFDKHGVRGLAVFGAIVLGCGAVGLTTFNMDMSILMVTVVYTTMSLGIQFLSTPLNTWGINSLDNKLIQHANSLSSTANQVGASLGTAFIVSLTAFGPAVAPAGSDPTTITFYGVHVAFVGMCCMMLIVVAGVLIFVRETPKEKLAERDKLDEKKAALSDEESIPGVTRPWAVSDVMNVMSPYILEGDTVRDAVDAMRKNDTNGVPIINRNRRIVGFVSDGDVLKYLMKQSGQYTDGNNFFVLMEDHDLQTRLHQLLDLDAMNIATKKVVTVNASDDPEDVFKTLSQKRIKKVPVVDDGKYVGCLSRRNIMNALGRVEEALPEESDLKEPKAETKDDKKGDK